MHENDATPFLEANEIACEKRGMRIRSATLSIGPGDRVIVLNASHGPGSLLHRVLSLTERPVSGSLRVWGKETATLASADRARVRGRHFAHLHTVPFLLNEFSVLENVAIPLLKVRQLKPDEAHHRALELLDAVDLRHAAAATPRELSAMDRCRVAISRALASEPDAISVDRLPPELTPTEANATAALLNTLAKEQGLVLIRALGFVHLPEPGETIIDVLGDEVSVCQS
jgi:lipoprotein-releasing system ATP-binding protein